MPRRMDATVPSKHAFKMREENFKWWQAVDSPVPTLTHLKPHYSHLHHHLVFHMCVWMHIYIWLMCVWMHIYIRLPVSPKHSYVPVKPEVFPKLKWPKQYIYDNSHDCIEYILSFFCLCIAIVGSISTKLVSVLGSDISQTIVTTTSSISATRSTVVSPSNNPSSGLGKFIHEMI